MQFHSVMVIITYKEIEKVVFGPTLRVYVAGSSGSGKTTFVKKFLASNLFDFERVYYFHPDFYEGSPVEWHNILDKQVIYRSALPSLETLREMRKNSVIVLDDVFDQVENSKAMDYLFRVLSGKFNLHVIVMTQRYFSNGPYGLNIRNCCDYHVLMRNADNSLTQRIARSLGHKSDITSALRLTENELYPYVFIDKTQLARVNKLQIYIDVISPIKIVVIDSMKYYLINEHDFASSYTKIDKNLATNENTKIEPSIGANSEECDSDDCTPTRQRSIERHVKRALYKLKKRSKL